ncbi:MAG: hypothetical protein OHK0048_17080 [Rhodoferax sp.]
MHVLIVDDDPFSRDLLREQLGTLGVQHITEADNGQQAIQRLADMRPAPDLIISDVFMPDRDGIELMDSLVQHGYVGAVILLSGVDMGLLGIARDLAQANGIRLLGAYPKPLSLDKLAELLPRVKP